MIKAIVVGDEQVKAILKAIYPNTIDELYKTIEARAIDLVGYVKTQKLSGPRPQYLDNVSDRLRRSITYRIESFGNDITAIIGTNVEYAAIHEYGGKTSPHEILPVHGKALAFMLQGQLMILKKVNHPGSNIPERSFLRSSLAENREIIIEKMKEAVRKAIVNG